MLVRPAGPPEQLSEVPSTSQPELLSEAVPAAAGSLDGDSEEAVRFYNPYEGLSRALDSRGGIKGTYKLPQHPEFLFSEEATVHRRSWTENLTYYTGTGYLSGEVSLGCPVHAGGPAQVPASLCGRHRRAFLTSSSETPKLWRIMWTTWCARTAASQDILHQAPPPACNLHS